MAHPCESVGVRCSIIMDALSEARKFVEAGIGVIPIACRKKTPDASMLADVGATVDGHASWSVYKYPDGRLPTDEELKRWFRSPFTNLGVVTGWRNLVVVDFDQDEFYQYCFQWAVRVGAYKLWAKTRTVLTSRGQHMYFFCAEPQHNATYSWNGVHVLDVKVRGYVLAPPSVHPSGATYLAIGNQIQTVDTLSDVLPLAYLSQEKAQHNHTEITESPNPWVSDFDYHTQKAQSMPIMEVLGLEESSNGRWELVICPLHDDTNPSMWVDKSRNKCGCHACGIGPLDALELQTAISKSQGDKNEAYA